MDRFSSAYLLGLRSWFHMQVIFRKRRMLSTVPALQQRLITDALMPILSAMEEEDGTLMADLITYELVEILDLL